MHTMTLSHDVHILAGEECKLVTLNMLQNSPALLKSVAQSWKIFQLLQSADNPVKALIADMFGDQDVEVECPFKAGCQRRKMVLSEFQRMCEEGCKGLYVKDWHAFLSGLHKDLYSVPRAFQDDYFNWYFKITGQSVDFRYIYVGGEGSLTHTHHDVCCSYSWSVNLLGMKRWYFWAPEYAHALFKDGNIFSGIIVSDPREGQYDRDMFPLLDKVPHLTFIQGAGDAVFVPSGYYHFVVNLEPDCDLDESFQKAEKHNYTISLNHNWFNGFTLWEVFLFLLRDLHDVRREISYLREGYSSDSKEIFSHYDTAASLFSERDWFLQCDLILKANASLNLREFIGIISARAMMIMKGSSTLDATAFKWSIFLCSWYDYSMDLDDDDSDCLHYILTTMVDNNGVFSRKNSLSTFATSSDFEFKEVLLSLNIETFEFPMSVSTFSLRVIKDILNSISLCPSILLHVNTCLMQMQLSPSPSTFIDVHGPSDYIPTSLHSDSDYSMLKAVQEFNCCYENYIKEIATTVFSGPGR